MLTIVLITVGVLVVGGLIGGVTRGRMLLPTDQRRLTLLAEELHAQARIDAMTRATVQTARDIVKNHSR
jgi:uncharacterized membrane protein